MNTETKARPPIFQAVERWLTANPEPWVPWLIAQLAKRANRADLTLASELLVTFADKDNKWIAQVPIPLAEHNDKPASVQIGPDGAARLAVLMLMAHKADRIFAIGRVRRPEDKSALIVRVPGVRWELHHQPPEPFRRVPPTEISPLVTLMDKAAKETDTPKWAEVDPLLPADEAIDRIDKRFGQDIRSLAAIAVEAMRPHTTDIHVGLSTGRKAVSAHMQIGYPISLQVGTWRESSAKIRRKQRRKKQRKQRKEAA